jgi:alpha-glucosidase (family GH31 glycosyl hydrolase)
MRCDIHVIAALLLFSASPLLAQTFKAQCRQEGSTVVCGDARFQFLTPSLVRMEFSPTGRFVDAPTAIVLKRDWKQAKVEAWGDKDWIVAKTARLILRYRVNSGKFNKNNLRISWKEGGREFAWAPGDSDRNNLGGILYSLDGLRKDRLPKVAPGILSRSGWFVLDDSRTPVWDGQSSWIVPRKESDNQDWYWFLYGRDYGQVLRDNADLCGKIPMIPRHTLGAWITDLNYEYLPGTELVDKYRYTDKDVKSLVTRFRSEGIPLDILVLDFAWHRYGWKGGYDWSDIFPNPREFLDWAHQTGVKLTLNDHPGYSRESVLSDEDSHAQIVRTELGIPPPEKPSYTLDIALDWKFRTDPADSGVQNQWFSKDWKDDGWATVQVGRTWEDQGYPNYDGAAWYRKWVSIPVNLQRGSLYMVFGGVDDEYDLYVNGAKVAHHGTPNSSVFNSVTFTDVTASLRRGEENLIALRVNDWGGGGGMTFTPAAITDKPPTPGIRFNLAKKQHAQVFMDVLHHPLVDRGINFWWVDGGSGSCEMDGLNSQMWTNRVFYDFTERHTKKRGFIFSRYGGWGSHRYPSFFTGDTYSQWEVLAYQVPFTAQGGNVLMPYITHDIGGFIGPNVSFDLYARWIQFGVFSPFLRLHSAHENPQEGNVRMPWTYGEEGIALARKFFRLRYGLLPYIYTYCRVVHDQALPIVRPLYLEYPSLDKAYSYPNEYFFGKELLVAPVTDSTGEKDVYLPPGEWIDYFSGKRYPGDRLVRERYPLNRIPLFVRAGSIIPLQADLAYSDQRPLDTLIVDIYGPERAAFTLYEDDGASLDYRSGKCAWTTLSFATRGQGESQLTIGPTKGEFKAQPAARAYELRFHGLRQPGSVKVNNRVLGVGRKAREGWWWDTEKSVATVVLQARKIRESLTVVIE